VEFEGRFCDFAVFLKGVLEKEGVSWWWLDGEIVVECVVIVVA
jgi:hypothetical protein